MDVNKEEMIAALFGVDIDSDDYDYCDLEDLIGTKAMEEGSIPFVESLIDKLCNLIDIGRSPFTDARYKGFRHPNIENIMLIKVEIE